MVSMKRFTDAVLHPTAAEVNSPAVRRCDPAVTRFSRFCSIKTTMKFWTRCVLMDQLFELLLSASSDPHQQNCSNRFSDMPSGGFWSLECYDTHSFIDSASFIFIFEQIDGSDLSRTEQNPFRRCLTESQHENSGVLTLIKAVVQQHGAITQRTNDLQLWKQIYYFISHLFSVDALIQMFYRTLIYLD